MASISLISVNIERSKHLGPVTDFLRAQMPEILCVQELMEHDIGRIADTLGGAQSKFLPMMMREDAGEDSGVMGIGIFSRLPIKEAGVRYYHGDPSALVAYDETDIESRDRTKSLGVVYYDVEKDGAVFRIATTHFTWTPRGNTDDFQRRDIQALLPKLESLGELVFCGDFNAPRIYEGKPGEIFSILVSRYKDNIPPQYETSLDISLHRSGKDRPQELADKMVDGLFTTPAYTASDVVLHKGISDHCAITATITKD